MHLKTFEAATRTARTRPQKLERFGVPTLEITAVQDTLGDSGHALEPRKLLPMLIDEESWVASAITRIAAIVRAMYKNGPHRKMVETLVIAQTTRRSNCNRNTDAEGLSVCICASSLAKTRDSETPSCTLTY